MALTPNEVFRDFEVDGNEDSDPWQVRKEEARDLLNQMQEDIDSAAIGNKIGNVTNIGGTSSSVTGTVAGTLPGTTGTDLIGFTWKFIPTSNHPGGAVTFNPSERGPFDVKDAAGDDAAADAWIAGSETWLSQTGATQVRIVIGPNIAADIAALNVAVEPIPQLVSDVRLLHTDQVIGRPVGAVFSGAACVVNNTYVHGQPVAQDGRLRQVRVRGVNSGGAIQLKIFDRAGDVFTQDGSDIPLTISAGNGTYTKDDFGEVELTAGKYLGFFGGGTNNSDQKIAAISAAEPDTGAYFVGTGGGGNQSTFTGALHTGSQPQIGFDIEYIVADAAKATEHETRIVAIERQIDKLRALSGTRTFTIGRSGDPYTANIAGDRYVYAIYNRIVADGWLTGVRLFSEDAGDITIKVFDATYDEVYSLSGEKLVLNVAAGLNEFSSANGDFDPLPVRAGQRIGWYDPLLLHYDAADFGAEGGRIVRSTEAGDYDSFSETVTLGDNMAQIGFDFEYENAMFGSATNVLPGHKLPDALAPVPSDRSILASMGESTSNGSVATTYETASQYGHKMFAQGIRAAKADQVFGISQAGGTDTETDAEERLSNAANSYLYDNDDLIVDRGTTGLVAMADRITQLEFLESNVPIGTQTWFLFADGHGGFRIDQNDLTSEWWSVGDGLWHDAANFNPDVGCVIVFLSIGGNNANYDAEVFNDTIVSNLDAWQDRVIQFLLDKQAMIQGYHPKAKVHFLCTQISVFATGDGENSGNPRDGKVQKYLNNIQSILPNFTIVNIDGAHGRNADGVHHSDLGYHTRGLALARPAYEIARLGIRPRYPRPLNGWWTGSAVRMIVYSPAPLAIDTTTFGAITQNGLVVLDDGSNVAISSSTVNNSPSGFLDPYYRLIEVTLGATPAPGSVVKLRCGLDYARAVQPYEDEGIHCFRTTFSESVYVADAAQTVTLYQWLPHFEVTLLEI